MPQMTGTGIPSNDRWPVGAAARQLVPYAWVVVLTVVGAVAGAAQLTKPDDPASTATARIALTRAVEWPFYDATRSRVAARLDERLQQVVLAGLPEGGAVTSTEILVPESQAYLDVAVTASSDQVASDAARAMADRAVADDFAHLAQAPVDGLAAAEQSLAESQAAVDELNERVATGLAAASEARGADLDAEADLLDDQVRVLQIERDQLLYNQASLDNAVAQAKLGVATVQSDAEVVDVSSVSETRRDRRVLQLLVAGLIGGVTGLLVAWAIASRRAAVRSAGFIRHITGLPTAVLTPDGSGWDQIARTALALGASRLAIVGDGASAALASKLSERSLTTDVQTSDDDGRLTAPYSADHVVLVAVRRRTNLRDLARWAESARSLAIAPVGILIVDVT